MKQKLARLCINRVAMQSMKCSTCEHVLHHPPNSFNNSSLIPPPPQPTLTLTRASPTPILRLCRLRGVSSGDAQLCRSEGVDRVAHTGGPKRQWGTQRASGGIIGHRVLRRRLAFVQLGVLACRYVLHWCICMSIRVYAPGIFLGESRSTRGGPIMWVATYGVRWAEPSSRDASEVYKNNKTYNCKANFCNLF